MLRRRNLQCYRRAPLIYVDDLRQYGPAWYKDAQAARVGARNDHMWCHLFADDATSEELHAFAASLSLRREWFQGDHYDLVPRRRAQAVRLGAKELSDKESVDIWRKQREKRQTKEQSK